ncbi:hypothetical protein HK105_209388 [Polyrhizophydium stewartii]|uniref:Dynein regulatory complex protein 1/2 N-terminal domain-containing protein n=1 Tax=Polyrhizophydium stewartii TaxID=2732419 RepID=A0ABR4MV40_9FUNG
MPPQVVVGSGGVGKSCLTVRFLKDEFTNEYDPTIEENYRKNVTVDNVQCTAYIIDTAGQHEYKALRDQHLKDGKGFLLVFAVNDKSSLEEVKQLREQIMKLKETRKVPFVICANKCDLPADQVEVDMNSVKAFCQEVKIPLLSTSAKENINVEESFQDLVRECRSGAPSALSGSGGANASGSSSGESGIGANGSTSAAGVAANSAIGGTGGGSGGSGSGSSSGGGTGGGTSQAANDGGREARIAIRKSRIEMNRLAKAKPSERVDDGVARRIKKIEPEQKETGKAKAQIMASQKRIDVVKTSGNELVTNVRVGVTARESLRRQEEVRKIDVWKKKRGDEHIHSSSMHIDIDAEWEKIAKLAGPYELHEQKEACSALVAIKNKLISEYVAELKSKDDEYVKELKRQAEEIDKLLERMEAQFKTFQGTLVQEIEHIEKAFVEERTELIDANVREIERLFETRRQNEAKYMDERAERIEDHIKQLEALRVHDAEEYNLVKIKLETDVQVLEQQLQQMRATYQLNTEKLEYNFQVLKKREEENGTILGAQKRKINRLTDHLNILKAKAAKQERSFQQENASLTDDYRHLTEQFKAISAHSLALPLCENLLMRLADSKKYEEIWRMNEEQARELMRKVLQVRESNPPATRRHSILRLTRAVIVRDGFKADRIIYEQQLGTKWTPPQEDLFRNINPSFFQEMVEDESKSLVDAQAAFEDNMEERLAGSNVEGDTDKKESLAAKFQDHKGHSKSMKTTLELLCNEAGFLARSARPH